MTKPPQLSFLSGSSEGGRSVSVRDFQRMVDRRILDAPTSEAPYVVGSSTSKAAAKAVTRSGTKEAHERKTLAFLRAMGERGATDHEIDAHFRDIGEKFITMRPRRRNLVVLGDVEDSGRTRLTPSLRESTVWVATSQAQEKTAA